MNACVRKSPSGDRAMCVIARISQLSRAEGGGGWGGGGDGSGVPEKVMTNGEMKRAQ